MDEDGAAESAPRGPRERSRSRGRGQAEEPSHTERPAAWWNTIRQEKWPEHKANFWNVKAAAVELEFSLPSSERGRDKAWRDLGAFFIGSMKRRAVELSERRMTPEEITAFQCAKGTEVKNFVASKAFEILPDHLKPDREARPSA